MENLVRKRISDLMLNFVSIEESIKENYLKIELELPYFFNTSDNLEIVLEIYDKEVIIKNNYYMYLSEILSSYHGYKRIMEEYLLNKTGKFDSIIEEVLKPLEITHNLNLEKSVDINEFIENLEEIIINYSFAVTRYYNHIYDYVIVYSREKVKKEMFKKEIQRLIENVEKKTKKESFTLIEKKKSKAFSDRNVYFKSEDSVLAGIYSRYHLLEALRDLRTVFKEVGDKSKIYMLIDKRTHSISDEFVKDNLDTLDMPNSGINFKYIESEEDLKIIENKLEISIDEVFKVSEKDYQEKYS